LTPPFVTLWIAPNKQFVFSRLLNVDSDGDEVTSAVRLFHTQAAATGNAVSPTVDRCVTGTTSVLVDAEPAGVEVRHTLEVVGEV